MKPEVITNGGAHLQSQTLGGWGKMMGPAWTIYQDLVSKKLKEGLGGHMECKSYVLIKNWLID